MSPQGFYRPWLWWSLGWLGIVLLLALSLAPISGPKLDLPSGDKYLHALSYCVTMLWFAQLSARRWLLAFGLVALGALIEGLQGLTGYRHPDLGDAAANTAGVLVGWLLSLTPMGCSLLWLDRVLWRFRRTRE